MNQTAETKVESLLEKYATRNPYELGHALLHPKANTPFLRDFTFFICRPNGK